MPSLLIMILKFFRSSRLNTTVYQLPEPDMVVDPKEGIGEHIKFNVNVNVTALTVTRTNRGENEDPGWIYGIQFRVYSVVEINANIRLSSSNNSVARLMVKERDTTEVIGKNGVKPIKQQAFLQCRYLSEIALPSTIKRIGM